MSAADILAEHVEGHRAAAAAMEPLTGQIAAVADALIACFRAGGTVYTCGNGGSAADAQHLTGELIGHYRRDRRPLRAVSLATDPTVWTCIANDYSDRVVFSRQVEALARPGDVVCGFTTSGNSANVVEALKAAKANGATTVLFGGRTAGAAGAHADHQLLAPAAITPRVQELHTLMLHMISDVVDAWAAGELEA
ncbi:MAG: SIS domain-containing protein [Actinobacteria bacterium]|nr:SIS domain-containing protein [Actinomycetota bacterium]